MLTFEEKIAIIESFTELERKNVSLGRINYQYPESKLDKTNVVYHLHPNGNGFVYAEGIPGYPIGPKGMVNIRDFSAEQLEAIIAKSIELLSTDPQEVESFVEVEEETWKNNDGHTLTVVLEDDMWNVYAGLNLDGTFPSYNEARSYLMEEGFHKHK